MFLIEPTKNEFEGQFNIIASRTSDTDSPIFVLRDINKELEKSFPAQKFNATYIQNDSFNLSNSQKVKIQVKSSKAIFDMYTNPNYEKGEWVPSTFDTKVFFKD